jgi:hypothetical protein
MDNAYVFEVTMNDLLRMKIDQTKGNVMDLRVYCQAVSCNISKEITYYAQPITARVSLNIFTHISILEVWHDNEWPIIQLIRAKKFYIIKYIYNYLSPDHITQDMSMPQH